MHYVATLVVDQDDKMWPCDVAPRFTANALCPVLVQSPHDPNDTQEIGDAITRLAHEEELKKLIQNGTIQAKVGGLMTPATELHIATPHRPASTKHIFRMAGCLMGQAEIQAIFHR